MSDYDEYLAAIEVVASARARSAETSSKRAHDYDDAKSRIDDAFAEKTSRFAPLELALSESTADSRDLLRRVGMETLIPSTIDRSGYKGDPDAFIDTAPAKLEQSVEQIRQSVLALVRLNEKDAVDRKAAAERERVGKLEAERRQRDEERERLKEDQRLAAERAAAEAKRKQFIKFALAAVGIVILILVIALAL